MKGFTKRYSEELTLTRGGESVSLTLTNPPQGWMQLMEARWPTTSLNEKELNHRQNTIIVAKFLEPMRILDAGPVPNAPKSWEDYALKVHAELSEANINDADMVKVLAACMAVIKNSRPTVEGEATEEPEAQDPEGNPSARGEAA